MAIPAVTPRLPTVRAAALLIGALAAAALAWGLRPALGGSDPVGEIVAGCAWLAWLLAGWLALSVALCAATALVKPRSGPRRSVATPRYVPRPLSRLVESVVAGGLLATVLAGTAVPASAAIPTAVTASAHGGRSADPLEWPGLSDGRQAAHPHPLATGHARRHGPRVGLVSAVPRRATHDAPVVTVRTGDSLWSLAAAHLGHDATAAQIATEWPRWYAENRRVIGADPTLIRPGQRLRPPGERTADRAAHHPRRSTP